MSSDEFRARDFSLGLAVKSTLAKSMFGQNYHIDHAKC
jgi:hypothetical protein